ncbi:hypothetical protein OOK48_01590 [Streptomyces viridodiastaticus]|uniref:hypothetical protein n=1 Tax=Streptomyces albogriseolus TaxID=1887 RepID=UPI0022592794|nr:hypothetical protein [Streptomyces viridodiastaticus]MCX4565037.1 hypothetical protein [Streptomyces viridodiastaticus]
MQAIWHAQPAPRGSADHRTAVSLAPLLVHHERMESPNELPIVMITADRGSDALVLVRSDGKEARLPLPGRLFEPTSLLSRVSYPPTFEGLVVETLKGDSIVFELPRFDRADQLAGRLVVYLDQNKWRLVGDAMSGQRSGTADDRVAALRLAQWSAERKIILPASSGHYYETTKWSNAEGRYRLGLSILEFSRGWQLRDPLQVWRDEIRLMFRAELGQSEVMAPVVTLEPNSIHSAARGFVPASAPADFPPMAAFQYEALVSAVSLIDTMLDSEGGERGPERGWTETNQKFSDWLDTQSGDAQQKRKAIDAWLLSDLRNKVAEESFAAGMTPEQLKDWGTGSQPVQKMASFPALGLFREMLHERHLNRGTTWKPNDVIDMVYLSCAAGYADFVVCERQMREPLARGARRLGRSTQVFRSLAEAVSAVERALGTRPGAGDAGTSA